MNNIYRIAPNDDGGIEINIVGTASYAEAGELIGKLRAAMSTIREGGKTRCPRCNDYMIKTYPIVTGGHLVLKCEQCRMAL